MAAYWTLELAGFLGDAPWPCSRRELISYVIHTSASEEVLDNLYELPDDDSIVYENMKKIWADYPVTNDFLFNEE